MRLLRSPDPSYVLAGEVDFSLTPQPQVRLWGMTLEPGVQGPVTFLGHQEVPEIVNREQGAWR